MLPEFVMLALLKAWMPGEFPPVAATVPELVRLTVLATMAGEATPVDVITPELLTLAVSAAATPAFVPVTVPVLVLVGSG